MKSKNSWNNAGFRQCIRAKFPLTPRMSLMFLLAASSSVSAYGGNAVDAHKVLLSPVVSQQAVVKVVGSVKDANGEPLIGVSILVKGSTSGTVTDLDGNFNLNVPKGAVLEVSYVGYVTQIVTVNASTLNIVLK